MGGSFTFSKYKVLHNTANDNLASNEELTIIGSSPLHVANGYVSISPFAGKDLKKIDDIRIIPRFEYIGTRFYVSGAGNQISASDKASNTLYDYMILHLVIFVDIAGRYQASFAIHNILDEIYYMSHHYPGAGRSFNISFGAKF
jgi:outer membrane receptor protein involved in Fe transport